MSKLWLALGLVIFIFSASTFGARPLGARDCAFLVGNNRIEILNPYGDGGMEVAYRDQLEDTITDQLPLFRANGRAIPSYFDMMNFIEGMSPASPQMLERAQLDMTGAYFLAAYSDTDGLSFAQHIRIVKDMYDLVARSEESIPLAIRASVYDSVFQAARPELRKHSRIYTWATFVQFPICQITGLAPGGKPLEFKYIEPVGTLMDIVTSEAFGRHDLGELRGALQASFNRRDGKWRDVGWLLVASANARPEALRSRIIEMSQRYLNGSPSLSSGEWGNFLSECNTQFIRGRAVTN